MYNNNLKVKNGKYFVEDTMGPNSYVMLTVGKNPYNIHETSIYNHGTQEGRPGADLMPIKEAVALELIRQQNVRKRQQFMGW